MKTSVVTLRGQDFVITEPARQALMIHLKKLQKSTRFQPSAYRDNVEALRDVLIEQGGGTVSKTKLTAAIKLVGLPEHRDVSHTLHTHFPRLYRVLLRLASPMRRLAKVVVRYWWQSLAVAVAIIAVVTSISYGFLALMTLQSSDSQGGWSVTATSIGQVRSYSEPHVNSVNWVIGWQGALLYSAVFLAIAVLVLQLRRTRRMPIILALVGCGILLLCLQYAEHIYTPNYATGANIVTRATPLKPHIAYLQQCGDEIQYVFDGQTSGMLFRRYRDEGFQLAATIPTRESDGTMNLQTLCQEYDTLRRDHPSADIVLQYYTQQSDGTIRPYEFSDLEDDQVTTSYGLFVKP